MDLGKVKSLGINAHLGNYQNMMYCTNTYIIQVSI